MENPDDLERRLATVAKVMDSPPPIHPTAPGGIWGTTRNCYEFLANHVAPGCRTLETGAGLSTVLFADWRCDHLTVVPSPSQATTIESYCAENGIATDSLTFDLRPSEVALPQLANSGSLDLVFIDGCHAFPWPIIDWFYGAGRLRRNGIVVFDDVDLPQVSLVIDTFLAPDDRWQELQTTPKWTAYRRLSEGPLSEEWTAQPFFPVRKAKFSDRALRGLKDAVPLSVRKKLAQAIPNRRSLR